MATLKISDLSVGDWVYHDDIVFGREIAKVHRLNKDKNGETIGITVYRSDGAFGVVGYIWTSPTHGDLHPIPITAEILEKNGLEYVDDGNDAVIFLCCDMFWARLCIGDTFWQVGIHSEDRLDAVVCNVKHIHQLQHALRLAGLDEEINL